MIPTNMRLQIVAAAAILASVVVRAESPGGEAQRFPNVALRTQDSTTVRFYDDLIKGRVVMINFMFTTCTSICPRTTANLVKVEEILGERLGRNVWMISISVDPANDTPEVLISVGRCSGGGAPSIGIPTVISVSPAEYRLRVLVSNVAAALLTRSKLFPSLA